MLRCFGVLAWVLQHSFVNRLSQEGVWVEFVYVMNLLFGLVSKSRLVILLLYYAEWDQTRHRSVSLLWMSD